MDLNKLGEVFEGSLAKAVMQTLKLMGAAEEEIARAERAYPDAAPRLSRAFPLLYPYELARFGSERVYRAHCREILVRVARGEDVNPGTDAECLAALSLGSLKAPLDSGHLAAMERVFASVFPEDRSERLGRESWPGEVDEILAGLRKRIGKTLNRREAAASSDA